MSMVRITGRTDLDMSTRHNLIEIRLRTISVSENGSLRTEVVIGRTPTFPFDVVLALWAMLEWIMPITDILEEVNLVPVRKQCGSD